MKKTIFKVGLCSLLAAGLLVSNGPTPFVDSTAFAAAATQTQAEVKKIKGKITNISQKAKTIALENKDNSFFLVKFTDSTTLKGVESTKDFAVDEAVIIEYTTTGDENIAVSLEKALFKLPEGLKEIKTDALAAMLEKGGDMVIIDARPTVRYEEGHIRGAVSIPFSKLTQMGDDGAKLLEKYMGKQLVFYCGGPT